MNIVDRYQAYAAAFEESYLDDDWSHIEPFFTENAVYEGEPEASGRDAVLNKLKTAVDSFDRKMDSRTLTFQTPSQEGNAVHVNWQVTYTRENCPDLVISGREVAEFQGDCIARLRDEFDAQAEKALGEWMASYGSTL